MAAEKQVVAESYLTFNLADELFAAPVSKVVEILEVPRITKVPQAPSYVKGVINLRGNVLPLIETRLRFGFEPVENTVNTSIVVLEVEAENQETLLLGALVDQVREVMEVRDEQIKEAPNVGSRYKSAFIKGMLNHDESFIMLLDVDKVFSSEELVSVQTEGLNTEVNA